MCGPETPKGWTPQTDHNLNHNCSQGEKLLSFYFSDEYLVETVASSDKQKKQGARKSGREWIWAILAGCDPPVCSGCISHRLSRSAETRPASAGRFPWCDVSTGVQRGPGKLSFPDVASSSNISRVDSA